MKEKAMSRTYYKKEAFLPTSEDWHGNFKIANDQRYKGGFVNVAIFPLGPDFKIHRVLVSGNDDFAMEFDTTDMVKAHRMYTEILLLDDVRRVNLEVRGFLPF